MAYWLLKTEPSAYSFQDLRRDGRTSWDGVTNAQAVLNLRAMRRGDRAVLYHSGEKVAVGLARVSAGPVADPRDGSGRRVVVEVEAGAPLPRPVALDELKGLAAFRESPLLRQGRLSVVPLSAAQWTALRKRAATPP
jgi:predicted RNA-binding protein with PUA-like domain